MKAILSRHSTPAELAGQFAGFMRELAEAGVDAIRDADLYFEPFHDGEPVFFDDQFGHRHEAVVVGQGPAVPPESFH